MAYADCFLSFSTYPFSFLFCCNVFQDIVQQITARKKILPNDFLPQYSTHSHVTTLCNIKKNMKVSQISNTLFDIQSKDLGLRLKIVYPLVEEKTSKSTKKNASKM